MQAGMHDRKENADIAEFISAPNERFEAFSEPNEFPLSW
jgi:hypothetical protein